MSHLPAALYQAQQVQKIDQLVINNYQVPGYELMTRAGIAAYKILRQHWPRARKICVFAGPGNNGGDGYVVARLAHQDNLSVSVIQVGGNSRKDSDAAKACEDYLDAGGYITAYESTANLNHDYDVAIDALLGVGLDRDLNPHWCHLIDFINAGAAPVFALDVPTGINSDTGKVMGTAVNAAMTLSFIGLKQGLFTADAPDYCGQIEFDSLDIPKEVYLSVHPAVSRINECILHRLLPARRPTTHKGECGHVLIIGGAVGYTGAALLASLAALKTGAGLVSTGIQAQVGASTSVYPLECMVHSLADEKMVTVLLARADVIAIGPGLGQSEWAKQLFQLVLNTTKPVIVDADGLNLLANNQMTRSNWILTPHPGEAARLLATTTAEIQANRFAAVQNLVNKYNATVVLKGSGTLIASPGSATTYLCTAGNPGMASGGMGDVLTGVVASLCAQGLDREDAARAGVFMHARAADIAADDCPRGLIASDLMQPLRQLANSGK